MVFCCVVLCYVAPPCLISSRLVRLTEDGKKRRLQRVQRLCLPRLPAHCHACLPTATVEAKIQVGIEVGVEVEVEVYYARSSRTMVRSKQAGRLSHVARRTFFAQ